MHNAEHLLGKLQKKGWSEEELQHARIIFSQQEPHHHIISPVYDHILQWIVLLAIVASTIVVFLFLIPFVPFLPTWFSVVIIGILSICLGLSFELIIRNFTHLKIRHHWLYATLMPLLSAVILLGMYAFIYNSIEISQQYILIGIAYIAGFMAPYYARKIFETTSK